MSATPPTELPDGLADAPKEVPKPEVLGDQARDLGNCGTC